MGAQVRAQELVEQIQERVRDQREMREQDLRAAMLRARELLDQLEPLGDLEALMPARAVQELEQEMASLERRSIGNPPSMKTPADTSQTKAGKTQLTCWKAIATWKKWLGLHRTK